MSVPHLLFDCIKCGKPAPAAGYDCTKLTQSEILICGGVTTVSTGRQVYGAWVARSVQTGSFLQNSDRPGPARPESQ